MPQSKNNNIAYSELLNRCWEDPEYLAKFKENPIAALEDFGIPIVPGAKYHVVPENEAKPSTDEDIYLPYKERPGLVTLDDDMLEEAAGGTFICPSTNTIELQSVEAVIAGL